MFFVENWEMFYTDSKKEDLIDQVSIDVKNQRYVLDKDADMFVTDGCDENGNEICSTYVSRFVFDLIVDALKEKGFRECK